MPKLLLSNPAIRVVLCCVRKFMLAGVSVFLKPDFHASALRLPRIHFQEVLIVFDSFADNSDIKKFSQRENHC